MIAIPIVIVLVVVLGPWLYINVIRDDPPERLGLSDEAPSRTTAPADETVEETEEEADDLDGTWVVGEGSEVGYRAGEILFGQSTEGVGRTEAVTGELEVEDDVVVEAGFVVDMATIESDEDRRDNQFRGRIMDVESYPEAIFALTEPVELDRAPADGEVIEAAVTGEFTARGTTNPVTVDVEARRTGDTFEISGAIDIVWDDYGIPDPTFGPAVVEEQGEIELLLVMTRLAM